MNLLHCGEASFRDCFPRPGHPHKGQAADICCSSCSSSLCLQCSRDQKNPLQITWVFAYPSWCSPPWSVPARIWKRHLSQHGGQSTDFSLLPSGSLSVSGPYLRSVSSGRHEASFCSPDPLFWQVCQLFLTRSNYRDLSLSVVQYESLVFSHCFLILSPDHLFSILSHLPGLWSLARVLLIYWQDYLW